jgi:hypothetical protein
MSFFFIKILLSVLKLTNNNILLLFLCYFHLDAPKVGTVNEQVRGALAGQKPHTDIEDLKLKNALSKFSEKKTHYFNQIINQLFFRCS